MMVVVVVVLTKMVIGGNCYGFDNEHDDEDNDVGKYMVIMKQPPLLPNLTSYLSCKEFHTKKKMEFDLIFLAWITVAEEGMLQQGLGLSKKENVT